MDIGVYAHLMAQLCEAGFARLILEVPGRWEGDRDRARKLISTISHADKMARICQPPAPAMILELADKLLQAAEPQTLALQVDAAHCLIRLVSHASSMAGIAPQVANDISALVRPLINESLPTAEAQVRRLRERQEAINGEIRSLCH